MAKTKVLKRQIGEFYDPEKKKRFGVYETYWKTKDGSYAKTERIFVNEVEVKEKTPDEEKVKEEKVEA